MTLTLGVDRTEVVNVFVSTRAYSIDCVAAFKLSGGRKKQYFIPFQVFGDAKYLEEAKKCSEAIWSRGLLKKGYGICHGTAGNAYAFLELFNVTNNQMYLYRAWKVMSAQND